ncbi:aminoglycoside phosphotransferase family protein [Sanguibacter sp. 25GB23B1]|uniref:aminoglycoside phosphotransferase family protein n=1 Tax=unclassified Sanguibacter TaxID=2645534 RepID=UPI0032AEA1FF
MNTLPDTDTRHSTRDLDPRALDPDSFVARWNLVVDGDGFSTHSSHLLPVLHEGVPAMLKVALSDEERRGNSLMTRWGGRAAARVLEHDGPAVVLERATGPRSLTAQATNGAGSPRWILADARATRVLCAVVHDLHAVGAGDGPRSSDLVPLDRWFRDLLAGAGSHRGFVRRAATTARDLLDQRRDEVILHGDVHHANVLDFGDAAAPRWKAIDPKGLVGDRAFDYANMLCNPTHGVALIPGRLERQVDVVADAAGLATVRVLRWVVAWAGLSAVWFSAAGPGWMSSAARDASAASALAIGRTAEDLLR